MSKRRFNQALYDLWRADHEFDNEWGPAAHRHAQRLLKEGKDCVT
jgi:hypothetical protein